MHAGGTFPVAAVVSLILADFRLGVKSCTLVIDLLAFAAKYVHTKIKADQERCLCKTNQDNLVKFQQKKIKCC